MAMRGFTRKFKPLEIVTEEQIEAIHQGTLDVLQETGVRFESKRALKLFEKNDCQVDWSSNRVKFPPALVEDCLCRCPSSFRIKARDPKDDLVLGGDRVYFCPYPGMNTVDLDTMEMRMAKKKEYYDYITVLDALDNINTTWAYPYFGFEGIPPVMAIPEGVAIKIRNSAKVPGSGYSQGCEIFTIKMAKVVGTEILSGLTGSPPMTFYEGAVEALHRFIEAGFPIGINSAGVQGATAPVTIAGATITNNVEIIAGIVLIQLIKPGARVSVANGTFPQNMQTGAPFFGAIGSSLQQVVSNQVWRKYKIPVANVASGCVSSKRMDFQTGYEKAIAVLLSALSGAHISGLHGGIYGELEAHPVQAILDNDIAGMIGRFLEGVQVNEETLAVDLIEEVGPIPGHYLGKKHTREWWKKENFIPRAADILTYPEWIKNDKKSCIDYAKKKMEEIIATHKTKPLTASQEEDIEKILKEARKYYKEKGLL